MNFAHISSDRVVNIIVADDEETAVAVAPLGVSLVVDVTDQPQVALDWLYVDGELKPPPMRYMNTDRHSIPADGTTAATVTYTDTYPDAPEQVVFTVNGATKTVQVTSAGNAFLDVVSSTPGDSIVVSVDALPGTSLTITVES